VRNLAEVLTELLFPALLVVLTRSLSEVPPLKMSRLSASFAAMSATMWT